MDDNKIQAMPPFREMITGNIGPKEWLTYYINIWSRQLIANTIDVQTDSITKAINPDEMVKMDNGSGQMIPVKERLEMRKMNIELSQKVLMGARSLYAMIDGKSEEEAAKILHEKFWSKEALEVAPDMLEPEEKKEDKKEEKPAEAGKEAKA